ncbi:MAG: hypothetical protein HYX49_01785 [Chloroflexi bacterium]|nr:hypothetical protein [Chloroflexota bacterium]
MDDFESIVGIVKIETLINGIGRWIPKNPDINIILWINAWLGPHWIFLPQDYDIVIRTAGGLVYQGRFHNFPDSEFALDHKVHMEDVDDYRGFGAYLRDMSMDLAQTLQAWITPSLPAPEIQKRVHIFFEAYKAKASSWMPDISIDVVVCASPTNINVNVWVIKRWAKGNPFMGWALKDGTFTLGVDPRLESLECVMFPTKQLAVGFAKQHDWNVVGFVE